MRCSRTTPPAEGHQPCAHCYARSCGFEACRECDSLVRPDATDIEVVANEITRRHDIIIDQDKGTNAASCQTRCNL